MSSNGLQKKLLLAYFPGGGKLHSLYKIKPVRLKPYLRSQFAALSATLPAESTQRSTQDTHNYLEKGLSQIILDGRIGEKSIALILTGTDIPFDEKGEEVDLAMDIAELTAQIDVLKKRIARGRPETLQEWKTKITAKRQAREQRIFQRPKLLAMDAHHSTAKTIWFRGVGTSGEMSAYIQYIVAATRRSKCPTYSDLLCR
ncbi:hypothetical protein B0H13DRAFT_1850187 [Mycena leptocephala]|nr:hypothetical protein B0H13DRAFT_1850187 [Mycena leptocephala]